ncbi:ABC transporter ATP-binding protein [Nitratireductor indicus]|uniref:ABC transporter ATP-binding protein n=1 Tax=Nitratireductor indicus TaxID=721133 RepID=UPI0028745F1B|nr:ABC transporter ATP-binding protein [Nitratireductor indicus]MDS1135396.1 ABC transporter ATP-binding protein [Nitratireductor indicus]
MLLEVRGLETFYGRSQVLFGVDLAVGEGEVVTLMGRNGMGKTTTVRSIMGLTPPARGAISFAGQRCHGLPPHRIARLGLGLAPEGREIFPTLSVRENLVATAANHRNVENPWTLERIYALFPRLHERQAQASFSLSGGEQQMLTIGRALMTNPRLLILDEATEGLAPLIREQIWQVIRQLKVAGQAILLIDKNLSHLLDLADRHYVMEKGRVSWSGTSTQLRAELAENQRLISV